MNELSLYILDLVQNSISAGANLVEIRIVVSRGEDRITVLIQDDGCGMTPEFLKRAVSPFTTTRTTRKVGLGIPMIKELCELCQGSFEIESQVGVGTALHLSFRLSNIDLPPLGNLAETMLTLVNGKAGISAGIRRGRRFVRIRYQTDPPGPGRGSPGYSGGAWLDAGLSARGN